MKRIISRPKLIHTAAAETARALNQLLTVEEPEQRALLADPEPVEPINATHGVVDFGEEQAVGAP